jgi:MFS family permease
MTSQQRALSKRYLTYLAFSNFWFLSAVWLYFYRLFITDQQVGILDGMAFAIGLLAEVPSGALADRFGRDKMVRLGQFMAGGGFIIQGFGSDFVPFFVGQSIAMVGMAFISGADQALIFDRLNFKRNSSDWRKLMARASQISLISILFATVIGGLLHTVNPRLPWILTGVSFVIATIIFWPIKDTRPKRERQKLIPEIKEYVGDIKSGFLDFMTPSLRFYVPYILAVQGLFYVSGNGILRVVLLDRFNFSPTAGAIAVTISAIITLVILNFIHRNAETLSEKKVLTMIGLSASAGLLLSVADIGTWGFAVILVVYAGDRLLDPFLSEVLNYHVSEDRRATVLSVATFLKTLPYVALAPTIGYLSTQQKLEYFLVPWAILILISVMYYLSSHQKDESVEV